MISVQYFFRLTSYVIRPSLNSRSGATLAACLSLIAILTMSGCSSIKGFPDPPRTAPKQTTTNDADYELSPNSEVAYRNEADLEKKMILRNAILDARMNEIDARFEDFQRDIYREGVQAGLTTDLLLLALTAGTTVSTVETTKTTLAAISTAVVGGSASYDKRALFDKTLLALLSQMVAERESVRTAIRAGEQRPIAYYSLYQGLSDLRAFAAAGSIPGAISGVYRAAGTKTDDTFAQRKQLLSDPSVILQTETTTGQILKKFVWPDRSKAVDAKNLAALAGWMRSNKLAAATPGDVMRFINNPDDSTDASGVKFVTLRAQAIKALDVPLD